LAGTVIVWLLGGVVQFHGIFGHIEIQTQKQSDEIESTD
jgi:hypothetical protein